MFGAPDPMRLNDDVISCVGFVGYRERLAGGNTTLTPAGTVFFVTYPIDSSIPQHSATYAITAMHVIENIARCSCDGRPYFRLNTKDEAIWLATDLCDWFYPDDPTIDVAVLPIKADQFNQGHKCIPQSMFVTDEVLKNEAIGPGHDLFFPGLFVHHFGDARNLPIVRWGAIAAMPSERIRTRWNSINGILVEARSIGGLSGSPVFVHCGPFRPSHVVGFAPGEIRYYLLGLVHGHFGVDLGLGDVVTKDDRLSNSLNMGIAIIVPASDILLALNSPALIDQRAHLRDVIQNRGLAEPD